MLWDMDGTIVDTEPYWMAAETPFVESFGGTWTHEQALNLVGMPLPYSAGLMQEAGVTLSAEEIIAHLTNAVMDRIATEGVPYRPGAYELLLHLREAGIKLALVTMSMRRMALTIVAQMPPDIFDVVVAGDDVARPKPYPDPYLQACRALAVDAADCVAIEDSPNGLRSALASGATTLAVPAMVSVEGVGAHAVWPTLQERTLADLNDLHAARRMPSSGLAQ